MRRITDFGLEAEPADTYVAGERCLHFCAAPTLWGILLWDRPEQADAIALGRSLVAELSPSAVPHASIFDLTRVNGVDAGAFAAAGWYLKHHHDTLSRMLLCTALIRPHGLDGAAVAGAFEVLPRPYPVRVFADAASGYAWLRGEAGGADWPEDPAFLSALHAEASGTPALIANLRALIDRHLVGLAVADAAKRLGVSERTLQRKLGELGTTFQDEVGEARLRAAKKLLVTTDRALTAIALDIGFSSLQHFGSQFRQREGLSPSEYRQRMRK